MSRRLSAPAAFLVFVFAAAAIAAPITPGTRNMPSIDLNVAELQVIPAYAAPGKAPNVEHEIEIPPAKLATAWARQRIRAVGNANRASVIVREASVVEVRLKNSNLFRKAPDRRYDAKLTMVAEIRSDTGTLLGSVNATAIRKQEVMPETKGEARDAVLQALTRQLVADAAAELKKQIKAKMAGYAR